MGRAPCCDKANVKRGPWSPEEDTTLKNYVERHGTGGNWIALPQKAGLKRCGKSCRLRWLNYLRPDIKHGGFTEEEDNIIYTLYRNIGSRWSVIASNLQGRTDNDVKNYWNTKLKKKLHNLQSSHAAANASTAAAVGLPPQATPQAVIKTEPFGYGVFSAPVESIPLAPPAFADQTPPANFAGADNIGYVVSPPPGQGVSAASSSCPLAMDNNYGYYMDGFVMDMGFEQQSSELLNWYGLHHAVGDNSTTATTASNNASDLPNVSYNLLATVESKPPHGIHQTLTYS